MWGLNQSIEQGLFWKVCINYPPSKVYKRVQFEVFLWWVFPVENLPWSHGYGPGLLHTGRSTRKFCHLYPVGCKAQISPQQQDQILQYMFAYPINLIEMVPESLNICMFWESNTRKWKGIFHVFTERNWKSRSVLTNILKVGLALFD